MHEYPSDLRATSDIATEDIPASDDFKPAIEETDKGNLHTEVITYRALEEISDGEKKYKADKVTFTVTVNVDTMQPTEFNMTLTGADKEFKLQESF